MKKFILWALVAVAFTACKKDDENETTELQNDTRYTFTVTIKGYWTEETHPQDFPQKAKFGKIVGVSHKNKDILFKKGSKAASWMSSYFEAQNTDDFVSYFGEYKTAAKVDAIITEEGFAANGDTSFEFTTEGNYDKFSLLMQLVPSPDWFVTIHNISLDNLALGGYSSYVVAVGDAGIRSGSTYTEDGSATNESISYKTGAPLNFPNGGISNFAIVSIQYKSSEKIQKD